jgi:hypothetical protein
MGHKMRSKSRLEAAAPEKELAKVRRLEAGKKKIGERPLLQGSISSFKGDSEQDDRKREVKGKALDIKRGEKAEKEKKLDKKRGKQAEELRLLQVKLPIPTPSPIHH